ncbi:alpha/beta fold hydrolase [Thalassovita aquimarina]|uniref:Alpha/beta hydrolase n=1 Tax=Thalassovita aquimarina TaxID=2785917 RepID=A0ABS5HS72_9RHOB|nr:alpha/beta hydrolase [Thalassovita aquimarina]MBR9651607.1 alpha/beta hydrolase [Thalassovita aquimarina]
MGKKTKRAIVISLALVLGAGMAAYTPELPAAQVEQKYATPESRFVEIDGLRVHYRDQGQGPALVLVHGSNASLQTWEGWVERLSEDFRVISLDLPGHGLTGPDPQGRYDWISMATLVDQLVQRLKLDTFSLAGNSMGGAVAWNYAVMHPDKIEKLILIDSRGYPSEEPMPAIFKAYATPVVGHLLTRVTPRAAIASSLRKVYGDPDKVDAELVTQYHDLTLRAGNREATRERLSVPSNDRLLPRIGTITAPTLILWGTDDSWILPKYATRFLQDIENSTLRLYDGLGHAPMEEDPERTARDVRAFLLQR